MSKKRPSKNSIEITKTSDSFFNVWWKFGDSPKGGYAFASEKECRLFVKGFQAGIHAFRCALDEPDIIDTL